MFKLLYIGLVGVLAADSSLVGATDLTAKAPCPLVKCIAPPVPCPAGQIVVTPVVNGCRRCPVCRECRPPVCPLVVCQNEKPMNQSNGCPGCPQCGRQCKCGTNCVMDGGRTGVCQKNGECAINIVKPDCNEKKCKCGTKCTMTGGAIGVCQTDEETCAVNVLPPNCPGKGKGKLGCPPIICPLISCPVLQQVKPANPCGCPTCPPVSKPPSFKITTLPPSPKIGTRPPTPKNCATVLCAQLYCPPRDQVTLAGSCCPVCRPLLGKIPPTGLITAPPFSFHPEEDIVNPIAGKGAIAGKAATQG